MSADLSGTSILVTGAGRGLGREMATALAEAGASVALMERDRPELDEAASAIGAATDPGRVLAVQGDVTGADDAARAVDEVNGAFGKLDMLVNNAALGPQEHSPTNTAPRRPIWEADLDLWLATVAVNSSGPFIMTRAALPGMLERGWGRIVNVTTSLDTMLNPGLGPYGPAKAATEALTSILAFELEETGVTANVLVPGGRANTRMIPADGKYSDRNYLIQPEVMRAPIVWLASRATDEVNGRRFRAALFDPELAPEEAAEKAGAPVAWRDLMGQTIHYI